ncbi:response regulator transcription factor [Ruminiclostridium cellobioparum]|jgi:DNA-binding response OmpR family regulator|uniref:Stage 0 sporulation protein A homolog n=1 Tax=Ruminiclostridium cellobioparum subsp. termitidis CT1112 TaxID=1195236 RepID=S0FWB2_RUMCE|nr:response regulator transcription factor [Ruminiclostridium cellobioparum]EMS73459.1 two component transcriptional regulatory protein [Ruminiclostridium cellobioparum subsp. termitidis CT1112]
MNNKSKVLIVDDDRNICELIGLYLQKEGYEVLYAYNGISAVDAFKTHTPSLVVLDIMLPGIDGWQVCREIRKVSSIPIIMLTAKGETFDKVLGLELGADDYMVKPFEPKELVARIKAVLRRYEHKDVDTQEVVFPNLIVNKSNYTIRLKGNLIELPPKELELLFFLASNPNKVFTREQLLEHVWGFDFYGDSRTVDVHVKRVREKIDLEGQPWQLKTVWGVGYKFEVK